MTLVQVAGDQLSKGMLSLIENGKAKPSMESLQYIAKQLQIDVSELLQDETYEEITQVYNKVDEIVGKLNLTDSLTEIEQYYENMLQLIEPLVKNGSLHMDHFESIRLLELYYGSLYETGKIPAPIEQLKEIEKAYEKINAHSRMIKCGIIISSLLLLKRKYKESLDYLVELEKYIHLYGGRIDDVQRLNLYYQIAITSAIFNDFEKIEYASSRMLAITKRSGIFYQIDNLYRFLFIVQVEKCDKKKCKYYLDKLAAFAKIAEEASNDYILQYLELIYLNQIERNYEQVIKKPIKTFQLPEDFIKFFSIFINGEKAYAHIMRSEFKEAKARLTDISITKHHSHTHPIDLSFLYRAFAMRGLCLYKEGDIENAKRDVLYAMDGVKYFGMNRQVKMIEVIYNHVVNNEELNLEEVIQFKV